MITNKMLFGMLITLIGVVFSAGAYICAALNPWIYNNIDGILGALLGNHMLIPFILGVAAMLLGLALCAREAYCKK